MQQHRLAGIGAVFQGCRELFTVLGVHDEETHQAQVNSLVGVLLLYEGYLTLGVPPLSAFFGRPLTREDRWKPQLTIF